MSVFLHGGPVFPEWPGSATARGVIERASEHLPAHASEASPDFLAKLDDELQVLRRSLLESFERGSWGALLPVLDQLARLGELSGQRALCLRAQSLREQLNERAGVGARTGVAGGARADGGDSGNVSSRTLELFDDLLFHLSHLQWVARKEI